MKTSAANISIGKRTRQAVVLALTILFGVIVSISTAEAKDDGRFGKKNVSEIRRQNKRYANACELLKEKRKFKPSGKTRSAKWR